MHAIVTSGGASHGSYQLGWSEKVAQVLGSDFNPTLYVGTSVGGLFASMMAMHSTFVDGANAYAELWDEHVKKTKDIYKTWWPSWLSYLAYLPGLWKGSLFDARPLQKLIEKNFDPLAVRSSGKKLILTSTNMETGALRLWREEEIFDWKPVYATAAYPLGFQMPLMDDGNIHTDGGVREVTPLSAAIKAGATVIDVIMCQSEEQSKWKDGDGIMRLVDRATRVLSLLTKEIIENDIKRCTEINQRVLDGSDTKHRFVEVRLHRPIGGLRNSSLNFDREVWQVNRERGMADAQMWLDTL